MANIEQIRITGVLLRDLLGAGFIKEIDLLGLDLQPIALIMISKETQKEDMRKNILILNHESPHEIDGKVLHVTCKNEEILLGLKNILEKNTGEK